MTGWRRFFNFRAATDGDTLQALLVIRLFGVDLAVLLTGCVLDWALAFDLQPLRPKYFARVALAFAQFTIGRNNDLYS